MQIALVLAKAEIWEIGYGLTSCPSFFRLVTSNAGVFGKYATPAILKRNN